MLTVSIRRLPDFEPNTTGDTLLKSLDGKVAIQRLATENEVSLEEMKQRGYANVALHDAGEPEAVAYLVSPGAAYVTGVALPVAGGVPFGI